MSRPRLAPGRPADDARHRLQKTQRVRVARRGEQCLGRRLLDDAPGIHHGNALRGFGHHGEIMRNEDRGHADLGLKVAEELQDLRLRCDIQRRRRLIGYDQLRTDRPTPSRS